MKRKKENRLKSRVGAAAREVMGNNKESAATQVYADKALGSRAEIALGEYTLLQSAHVVPAGRLPMEEPNL